MMMASPSMTRTWRTLAFLSLALYFLAATVAGNSLMGPGSLQPYTGGGGNQNRGYGYVQEFPAGFFIAGSTLYGMNGVYSRVGNDADYPHACHYTYRNEFSGWQLVYANSKAAGYESVGGEDTEWILIDGEWKDRFAHKGATYLPGSGDSWKHLHRPQAVRKGGFSVGDTVYAREDLDPHWVKGDKALIVEYHGKSADAFNGNPFTIRILKSNLHIRTQAWRISLTPPEAMEAEGQAVSDRAGTGVDEDELPWQVIAIMSEERMRSLREMARRHQSSVRAAIEGHGLHRPPPGPNGDASDPPPHGDYAHKASDDLANQGDFIKAADALLQAITDADQSPDPWRKAVLRLRRGACLRRGRQPKEALTVIESALELFPSYRHALFEQAMTLFDLGRISEAIGALEMLFTVDRQYPHLEAWLIRGHARMRRNGKWLVAGNLAVGDRVKCAFNQPGFWEANEDAIVHSMGNPEADIAIKLVKTGRVVLTQVNQVRIVDASEGGTEEDPDLRPRTAAARARGDGSSEDYKGSLLPVDYYSLLGLKVDFSPEELRKAYRDCSRRMHPDKGGNKDEFQELAQGNEILQTVKGRQTYDEFDDEHVEPEQKLREVVRNRYYPDRKGMAAFGDPFERKREHLAAKARQEEALALHKRRVEEARLERLAQGEDMGGSHNVGDDGELQHTEDEVWGGDEKKGSGGGSWWPFGGTKQPDDDEL